MVFVMSRSLIVGILVSLIVGIGGGYAFSYGEISGIQCEIESLESDVSTLTTDYDNLDIAYNQLASNYSDLNVAHNELQTACNNLNVTYNQLLNDYDFLESEYEKLNSSYNDLLAQHNILRSNYDSLNSTHNELQSAYEELEEEAARLLVMLEEAEDRIAELEHMAEYEIHVLLDEEYYQHAKKDLEKANETILVAMYSMVYDPGDSFDWANDLIRELVYANERVVDVTVIIENRTFFGYMDDNLEAYNYLSAHNITVRLDDETDTDHMKLVIIDDKIVYVGSHNWSESALYYNHETSVKIVSEDVAEIFKAYFDTI